MRAMASTMASAHRRTCTEEAWGALAQGKVGAYPRGHRVLKGTHVLAYGHLLHWCGGLLHYGGLVKGRQEQALELPQGIEGPWVALAQQLHPGHSGEGILACHKGR